MTNPFLRLSSALKRIGDKAGPVSLANPAKNLQSEQFEVDSWAISKFVLQKLVPVVGSHPFPLDELMLVVAATCRTTPSMIFDWGTHHGKSARIFYECVKHYRIEAEIHSADLAESTDHAEHPGRHRGKFVKHLAKVHLHQGDGVSVSLDIWRSAGKPARPLFFVDGDHSFDSVLRELSLISEAVDDATILVHDTFYQDRLADYNTGPHRAIEETLAASPGRYKRLQIGLGLPGLTLLYPQSPGN